MTQDSNLGLSLGEHWVNVGHNLGPNLEQALTKTTIDLCKYYILTRFIQINMLSIQVNIFHYPLHAAYRLEISYLVCSSDCSVDRNQAGHEAAMACPVSTKSKQVSLQGPSKRSQLNLSCSQMQ